MPFVPVRSHMANLFRQIQTEPRQVWNGDYIFMLVGSSQMVPHSPSATRSMQCYPALKWCVHSRLQGSVQAGVGITCSRHSILLLDLEMHLDLFLTCTYQRKARPYFNQRQVFLKTMQVANGVMKEEMPFSMCSKSSLKWHNKIVRRKLL